MDKAQALAEVRYYDQAETECSRSSIVDEFREVVTQLENVIASLRVRLNPALQPEDLSEDVGEPMPLVSDLRVELYRLHRFIDSLRHLEDRLEI